MLSGSLAMFPLQITHNMYLSNGGFRRNHISYRMTTILRLDSESGQSEIDPVQATASSPLRWIIESSRSAGPPGFFAPRSQSETRFFDTLR